MSFFNRSCNISSLDRGIPNFPGIETHLGLAVLRGRVPTYLRILKKFRDTHDEARFQRLRVIFRSDDRAEQRLVAHSMKGTASTIGATELSEAASALEIAVKGEVVEQFEPLLNELLSKLKIVVDGLIEIDKHLEGSK